MNYYYVEYKQFDYEDDYDRNMVVEAENQRDAESLFDLECPHGAIGRIEEIELIKRKNVNDE